MLATRDKIIHHKTGLLNLAEELGSVSKARQEMRCPVDECEVFVHGGVSRDPFVRYKSAVDAADTIEAVAPATKSLRFRAGIVCVLIFDP